MTTIVADRRMMAADRRVTDDSGVRHGKKIVRMGDAIIGCAGTSSVCVAFMRYLSTLIECGDDEEATRPTLGKDEELSVLILTPDALYVCDESCEFEEITDSFYAVGSGSKAALAAMYLGCDPIRAVEIASLVDSYTGGPIDAIGFGSPPK